MFKLFILSFLLAFFGTQTGAQAVTCKITSCSGTVLLNGNKISPLMLVKKSLTDRDELQALGEVLVIGIECGGIKATKDLHAYRILRIEDITHSTFNTLPDDGGFKAIFGTVWDFFFKENEGHEQNAKRFENHELGGKSKSGSLDVLSEDRFRRSLGPRDSSALRSILISATENGKTDSVVLELKAGVYFEQNHLFAMANARYRHARELLIKEHRPAVFVTAAYRQFLYRMGRDEEADNIR